MKYLLYLIFAVFDVAVDGLSEAMRNTIMRTGWWMASDNPSTATSNACLRFAFLAWFVFLRFDRRKGPVSLRFMIPVSPTAQVEMIREGPCDLGGQGQLFQSKIRDEQSTVKTPARQWIRVGLCFGEGTLGKTRRSGEVQPCYGQTSKNEGGIRTLHCRQKELLGRE